eukprot:3770147-Ditylum_brightwellii.AAC.1
MVMVDGFDYANKHLMLYIELDCLRARATEVELKNKFVENIVDADFQTIHQLLENCLLEIDCGDQTLKVLEVTNMVESRQRGLNKNVEDNMELKSWCQSYYNKDSKATSKNSDLQTKLQLPNALFSPLSSVQKKAVLIWKNYTVNKEKEETSGNGKQKRKGKRKKSGTIKVQLTGNQTSEPKSEEVHLIMKSDEEDTSSDSASSLEDTRKVGTNKVVRKNRSE